MSDKKYTEDDPERTLITLDQLSQTIEVMTSVVNRLRRHLSEQLKAQVEEVPNQLKQIHQPTDLEIAGPEASVTETAGTTQPDTRKSEQTKQKREGFIVEISQQDTELVRKQNKILH